MKKIVYIMGKSSSGKDTIYNRLLQEGSFKTVVGYTTRPMRQGETDGKEYYFVNEEEMNRLEQLGKVIEKRTYNTVHGLWNYFTVDDGQFQDSEKNMLLIGTLEAYEKLREYFGQDKMLPIYIEVETGLRLERALAREKQQKEPKYVEMCRRFLADEKDFSEENIRKLNIEKRFFNNDLEECIEEIKSYIKGEIAR